MLPKKISEIIQNQTPEVTQSSQVLDEAALWDLFRSGSESAFIIIYQSYFDILYAYGLRITADKELVKDTIQDLFIYLRKNRSNLGATDSIKFYLYKCIKRNIIKACDKWNRKLEGLDENYYFQFTFSHEHHLINSQIDDLQKRKLDDAVSKLSTRKKEVIYYFFYEGLTYLQIKEIMGLENIKSARNLIYKALDFLRVILAK